MSGAAERNEELYSAESNEVDSGGGENSSSGESEEEVDPEEEYKLRLIKEVEKRQVLWDTRRCIVDRKKREYRRGELWEEVAAALCGKNLTEMTERKAQLKVERAQKKWKNVKDCYFRYVNRRQRGEKVRRYRYFEQLQFLKPIVLYTARKRKIRDGSAKQSTSVCRGSKRPSKRPRKEPASSNQASSGAASRTRDDASSSRPGGDPASGRTATSSAVRCDGPSGGSTSAMPLDDGRRPMTMPCGAVLQELLGDRREPSEPDEDRDFFSSLLPQMKKMDDDRRHFARKHILDAMRKARRGPSEPDEDRDFFSSLLPQMKNWDDDKRHFARKHILDVVRNARYWVPDAEVDLLPGSVPHAHVSSRFPSSTSSSHKGDEGAEI